MNEIMMPGPASCAATRPVIEKMPAPMIAPTPSDVSEIGPRTRRSRFSPAISASSVSSVLRWNIRLNMDTTPLGRWPATSPGNSGTLSQPKECNRAHAGLRSAFCGIGALLADEFHLEDDLFE